MMFDMRTSFLILLAGSLGIVTAGPLYPNTSLTNTLRVNTTIAIPVVPQPLPHPKVSNFTFGVLGDSWASGVSFNKRTEWDGNAGNCFRSTDSYGVQMAADDSWAGENPNFNFTACSGSKIGDVAGSDESQSSKVKSPNLLVITTGGNDAGFFDVADSCVYQSNPKRDYGLPYHKDPDRIGACTKAIDAATDRVVKSDQIGKSLTAMYTDILNSDQAKANPDLRIYQTGYVHYFNVDDGNTWCDKVSFHPGSEALLTLVLRKEFNELVERANGVIQQVVSTFSEHHVNYVSITESFGGHRFCEPDSNRVAQFTSSNVWNWNIQPSFFPPDWKTNDGGTDSPIPFPEPLFQFDDPSPSGTGEGVWRRPFHPKKQGYSSIKASILAKLKADKFSR